MYEVSEVLEGGNLVLSLIHKPCNRNLIWNPDKYCFKYT